MHSSDIKSKSNNYSSKNFRFKFRQIGLTSPPLTTVVKVTKQTYTKQYTAADMIAVPMILYKSARIMPDCTTVNLEHT